MSISFKEGLKIPAPAMNEIIIASNHDIRQVRIPPSNAFIIKCIILLY